MRDKVFAQWLPFIILSFFYFSTRLYHLTILPIFTDEAIYIYWAKFIGVNHSHWFLSLTDGKPPVLTWIIAVFLQFLPASWYLTAGRLPSVFYGFVTLLGIYTLSLYLFKSRLAAIFSSILYIISPFALLYDRLALYDSQLCAMLIWSVYFAIKTARTQKLRDGMLWGFFLGLSFLAKPPAVLFLILTPVCFLLAFPKNAMKKKWKLTVGIILLVFVISEGMNNLQRVSGAFAQAIIKNQQFQQPIADLIRDPLQLVAGNLYIFSTWLIAYYSLPILGLGFVAFLFLLYKERRTGIIFLLLWTVPILAFAAVAREVFPRYLLFISPYLFLPIGYLLSVLMQRGKFFRIGGVVIFIAVLLLPAGFSLLLLTDPVKAPLPTSDYNQLVSEHPSGYGIASVVSYLNQKMKDQKIVLVTQGTFGLYPYAFYLEYWGNPQIRILPRWPLSSIDEEIYQAAKDRPVYVLLKEHTEIPPQLPLDLVLRSEKPSRRYPLLLTKLRAQNEK